MDVVRQLRSVDAEWAEGGGELPPLSVARRVWREFRPRFGFKPTAVRLLTPPSSNSKLKKSERLNYGLALVQEKSALFRWDHTRRLAVPLAVYNGDGTVMRLADTWPGTVVVNFCRFATKECARFCVAKAGKGGLDAVQLARSTKAGFLLEAMPMFTALLTHELRLIVDKVLDGGLPPAIVRLNTFSDVPWEELPTFWSYVEPYAATGALQFYDYTKWPASVRPGIDPDVYFLSRSVSEKWTPEQITATVEAGHQCVIVASDITSKSHHVPPVLFGVPAVDGDRHDDRILDGGGTLVVLRPKGELRGTQSPFKRPVLEA